MLDPVFVYMINYGNVNRVIGFIAECEVIDKGLKIESEKLNTMNGTERKVSLKPLCRERFGTH